MTQLERTEEVLPNVSEIPSVAPAPRRRFTSRLSFGHVIMVVAALMALVANYVFWQSTDTAIRVAVAATEIREGQTVKTDDLAYQEVDGSSSLLATMTSSDLALEREGWVATRTIAEGEAILTSDLQSPSVLGNTNLRAISIPVPSSKAVSGDISRGDLIDVIFTDKVDTEYVVIGVEVLGVKGGSEGGVLASNKDFEITVAVDALQALRVAAAISSSGNYDIVRSTGASLPGPDQLRFVHQNNQTTQDSGSEGE